VGDIEQLLDQAQTAWEAQDLPAALTALTEALEAAPEDARVWRALGRLFNELGEGQRALEASDHALALEPSVANSHYQRGLALQALERESEALAAFVTATELDPCDAYAWVNRGRLLDDGGQHADALECYDLALALEAGDEIAWTNHGNSNLALERFSAALESYERALEVDPQSGPARLGRASTLLELGRVDEANAANPGGTAWDRGTAYELSQVLSDGRMLVVRYQTEGHDHPQWLAEEAAELLKVCAGCADVEPGLREGTRIAYMLSWLTVREDEDGATLVLCEPNFAKDPFARRHGTVSFTLKAQVMMNMLHSMVNTAPVEASFADVLEVGPEVLSARVVVARRLALAREGHSGWWLGPEDPEEWKRLKLEGNFVQMRAAEFLALKPWLAKPLTLPVGWVARFEEHRLTSVRDEAGRERWASDPSPSPTETKSQVGKKTGGGKSAKGGKGPWA
jgi:tetratricopeptide (TPR) repeat protein